MAHDHSKALQNAGEDVRKAIELLHSKGFEILRPLSMAQMQEDPTAQPGPRDLVVCVIDTETTGNDAQVDEAIEIGGQKIIVGPSGMRLVQRLSMLEEPTRPISEEAQRVHGLSLEDVRGHRFDESKLETFLEGASFVVAHNAQFDAPIMLRRFPQVAFPNWACSMKDVDWRSQFGLSSRTEDAIVRAAGMTYSAHRAVEDTAALTEALTQHRVWKTLEQASRQSYVQVWLEDTPFESGDAIRARGGFRWNDPSKGGIPNSPKAWHAVIDAKDVPNLAAFLMDEVYIPFPTARRPVSRNPSIIVRELPNRFLIPTDFPNEVYRQRVAVRSLLVEAASDEDPMQSGSMSIDSALDQPSA